LLSDRDAFSDERTTVADRTAIVKLSIELVLRTFGVSCDLTAMIVDPVRVFDHSILLVLIYNSLFC
jgi:hypothetical protein